MSDQPTNTATVMEQIVALAKRRGFIYPASDIYGGIRGFWDYGPLGVLLKNNIRDHWWNWMVECPPIGPDGDVVDMVGLDSSIIQHPKTWIASGHVAGFNDPMVDDKETKHRFRADKVFTVGFYSRRQMTSGPLAELYDKFYAALSGRQPSMAEVRQLEQELKKDFPLLFAPEVQIAVEGDNESVALQEAYDKLTKRQRGYLEWPDVADKQFASGMGLPSRDYLHLFESFWKVWGPQTKGIDWPVLSPSTQRPTLTEPRAFNLMLDTYPGPIRDEANKAYLRPETAQGIFLNFKNIVDTTRVKVPFGVAQVGKSFRNEVTPRNFIFRSREFEQMEMEFFCSPDDALKWYAFWKEERMKWWLSLGVEPSRLKFRDHDADELSHYSKATVDIEYLYPFTAPDFGELEGIAHRGDFDLTQHSQHSGLKLDYFDQELQLKLKEEGKSPEEIKERSRYIPNVIEPASGLTRAVLVLLCEAYTVDANRPSGVYLKFKPKFAPIKLGIFPLVNKDGMPEKARDLYMQLRGEFTCEYDAKQSIGKRYARMDEIGTPFCCTIDGDTLTSDMVTIRDRDTLTQEKVHISKVGEWVKERLK